MLDSKTTAMICTGLVFFGILGILVSGPIAKWEKSHDYPFGQMCNSIFTLYQNSCDLKRLKP